MNPSPTRSPQQNFDEVRGFATSSPLRGDEHYESFIREEFIHEEESH